MFLLVVHFGLSLWFRFFFAVGSSSRAVYEWMDIDDALVDSDATTPEAMTRQTQSFDLHQLLHCQ